MNTHGSFEIRLSCSIDIDTNRFANDEQFEVFLQAHRDVTEVELVKSRDASFHARLTAWDLGRLVFTRTEFPGNGYVHRWRHLRKAKLDHWYVTIPIVRREAGVGYTKPPRLYCLAAPGAGETEDDGALRLYMPGELLSSMATPESLLNLELNGGSGPLLADYMLLLSRSLTKLSVAEVPHVVEATRCLVAACLVPSRDRLAEAQKPVDAIFIERARRLIGRKLAEPELTPETLCAELGVSRSRLYRLFQPLGGISAYIRRQRLLKTRDALSNSSDRRSVSQIAEEWGFLDPSAYSRMFRNEFGMSPSEAREEGWRGAGYLVGQQKRRIADQDLSLACLLQSLST